MSILNTLGPAKKDVEPEFARIRSGRTIQAIKEGWMYKKGGKAFSSFRRRYMILWTSKRIEYYTSDELSTMKGAVNLLGLQKRAVQRSDKLPKNETMYGFQIITEKRTWYFAVKDENEREDWIKTIRAVVFVNDSTPTQSPLNSPLTSPLTSPKIKPITNSKKPARPTTKLPKPPAKTKKKKEPKITETQRPPEEEDVPSDYDPEEILENLEREYDLKHNPHRQGKKAQGIEWSDDDGQDALTDDSLNEDEDIDVNYDWGANMNKVKDKHKHDPEKKKICFDDDDGDGDGELESNDSLNESESENDSIDSEREVAKYQKYVYNNEQPMRKIQTKMMVGRKAIDWDEDEFDSDSLSDETEESDDEKEYKPRRKPSTKNENDVYINKKKEAIKPIMNEIKYINSGHVIIKLYYRLDEYIEYKSNSKGKGIFIENVKRNKYGKKLYIKYGFDKDDKWYIESIDGEKIGNKLRKNIETMLKIVDLKNGYKVVFKKPTKQKKKIVKKNVKSNGKNNKKYVKSVNVKKKANGKNVKNVQKSVKKSVKSPKGSKSLKNKSNAKSSKSNNAKSPKSTNGKYSKNKSAKSPKNNKKTGRELKKKKAMK